MNISTKEWDEILINKTGQNLENNINNNNYHIPSKNELRIYLTRTQFHYLKLINDVSNLDFIKDKNIKLIIEKILKKINLNENDVVTYKDIIKKFIDIDPSKLYKYIENKLDIKIKSKLCSFKNFFIPNNNIKCSLCHRVSYKYNYCKMHYNKIGEKDFEKKFYFIFANINFMDLYNFLKLLERDLVNKLKILEQHEEKQNMAIKINRINNIIKYCKKNNDQELLNIIYDFIQHSKLQQDISQYFKISNKINTEYHNNIINKITKYINENNLKNINDNILQTIDIKLTENINSSKVNNKIIIDYIKYHLRLILKITYFIKKIIIKSIGYNKPTLKFIINLDIKEFIEKESTNCPERDIKTSIITELYNTNYNLINLTKDMYFDDHYYVSKKSLTYDVYGEVYNKNFNLFIPFVINIEKYNASKIDYIKYFYCFINGISFINIKIEDLGKIYIITNFLENISKKNQLYYL